MSELRSNEELNSQLQNNNATNATAISIGANYQSYSYCIIRRKASRVLQHKPLLVDIFRQ